MDISFYHPLTRQKGVLKSMRFFKPLIICAYIMGLNLNNSLKADEPAPASNTSETQSDQPDQANAPNSKISSDTSLTKSPYLPYQGNNPDAYLVPNSDQSQSIFSRAPGSYNNTGINDLSQITSQSALAQAFGSQETGGYYSEQRGSYSHPPIERIRLGPFDLRAALSTNVVSDDNLNSASSVVSKESDTSFGITPAILFEYGNHEGQKSYMSLVYAPVVTRFINRSDKNTENQNLAFNVMYPFQRLTLKLTEAYTQATGRNQDTNTRTTQTSNQSTLAAAYDLDDKISISSSLQHLVSSFSDGNQTGSVGQAIGQGDESTSLSSSLNYHLSDKMNIGPSINAGFDKPDSGKQQTFEQALIGLAYNPTAKISLIGQGGAEFRQGTREAQGGRSSDEANPIFSAGLGYTPFDSTSLSVSASRDVRNSNANSQQTVVDTNVDFSLNQRFFHRFYFNFALSYTHNDSQTSSNGTTTATNASSTAGSSQDTLVYRPSLTFNPTMWTSLAIYYQYTDNKSNAVGGDFHDNQMGLSLTAKF